MYRILVLLTVVAIFIGCESKQARLKREIEEERQMQDSLFLAWKADGAWEDSLRRLPTIAWQSYFQPDGHYAVDRIRLIDASLGSNGALRLIYFNWRGYKLSLSCDIFCQEHLPALSNRRFRNTLIFQFDSLVPEYVYSASIDVDQNGASSSTASDLEVVRVIYGKLLFSKE